MAPFFPGTFRGNLFPALNPLSQALVRERPRSSAEAATGLKVQAHVRGRSGPPGRSHLPYFGGAISMWITWREAQNWRSGRVTRSSKRHAAISRSTRTAKWLGRAVHAQHATARRWRSSKSLLPIKGW